MTRLDQDETERAAPVPTRFAPAHGARLAYQLFGRGAPTVVAIPPTAQNIELSWEQPAIRAMLERFGSFCRYLHFDKRGTGCSDRRGQVAEIDERVDDLRAVMDHAGIERAHLFGSSEGGPMTLLFAATYPERVAGLILFGTGASLFPPDLTEADREARREIHRAYAARWGTEDSSVAAGMAPTLAAADPGFAAWHRRYERFSASVDSLLDLLELTLHMDVRDVAPRVDAPALVIHRTDDPIVPVERGREIAALLPHASLLEQPGPDHFAYSGDVDGWLDEVERFVTGSVRARPAPPPPRSTVRIVTLGRFAVEVDGREVPTAAWGSRRARQLCKRLVAARGWPVTRDELFDLLWPDETARERLGARLSVQLSTVRRILRGGVIADRQCVRLDLDEVDTDLEQLLRSDDDATVLSCYGGRFLPDDVYEAWTDGTRAEARARFVLAARRRLDAALEDDPALAVGIARRLVEDDPYDVDAHERLVAALRTAGAHDEARHAAEALRGLCEELGLPAPRPSDRTSPPRSGRKVL